MTKAQDTPTTAAAKSLTRRAILAGAAAAAMPALAAPALAATGTDAELLTLCQEVLRITKLYDEANAAFDEMFSLYREQEPSRPAELKWHPFTAPNGIGRISERISDSKCRLWCDPEDIEAHRNKPFTNWQMEPDEKAQEQFNVILAAHDRHQAATQALKDQLGYDVAERTANELHQRGSELAAKIIETKATTVEGLRAKANVVLHWCWAGELEQDWVTTDSNVMASIVRDLSELNAA